MRLFLIIPLFFFLIGCNSDSAEKETSTQIESKQPENVSEKGKIIFFGNSITAAYKLDPKDGFSNLIQQKIDSGDYNDSVHKITLITARDVIAKVLRTDFNY